MLAALLTALTAGAVAVASHLRDDGTPSSERAPFAPVELEGGVVLALGRGVAYTVTAAAACAALGPGRRRRPLAARDERGARLRLGLVAVHVADGQVRWRVPAPGPVSLPRWSLERTVPPCCRVAYLAGGALYVVGGDGQGARRVAAHALAVAPAWRPRGGEHELAFAAPGGIRIARPTGRAPARARAPARSA